MGTEGRVENVMRSPPVTVLFSDSVRTIANRIVTNNIGAVIVMRGGKPVGMVTERDIADKILRQRRDRSRFRQV